MKMKIRIAKTDHETFKEKVHRVSHNAKEEVKDFYQNHKVGIYVGGTLLLSVAGMAVDITKTAMKRRDIKMQDLRIYDRSLDIWWDLRKKLTTDQRLEINDRMKAGEKLGDILRSMDCLKRR